MTTRVTIVALTVLSSTSSNPLSSQKPSRRGEGMRLFMWKAIVIACMAIMPCGSESFAKGWAQNLDAKPIELPCGLKFGEVYEGAIKQVRTNYINGVAYKSYEAVVTNSWCGFDEITLMLSGEKRIAGVMGMRRGDQDFDAAVSNLVAWKEMFARRYGVMFMGDIVPKTMGDMKMWSITGVGAGDETVSMNVTRSKWKGEKAPKVALRMSIYSRIAERLETKNRDAEAADMCVAIRKVFGVDLEMPQSKPLWGFEWEKLPTPIAGLTERRCATEHKSGEKIEYVSFRHVFEGDVSRAELEAAARRIVIALEKAYGKKLPDDRKNLGPMDERGRIVPAAYDTQVLMPNQYFVAYGAVGSLFVTVEYAEPRYALRNGKYELVFKGGVKFSASRVGWMR